MDRTFVIFGGQSSEYLEELKLLALNPVFRQLLESIEGPLSEEILHPEMRCGFFPEGFTPYSWATGRKHAPLPEVLVRSEVSQPMLFLTAVGHALVSGLFPEDKQEIVGYSGHSQGIVAALFVSQGKQDLPSRLLAVTRSLMWQGVRMQNSCGWFSPCTTEDGLVLSPMLAIAGFERPEIEDFLARLPSGGRPEISLCNAPDRFVLSGNPRMLKSLLELLPKLSGTGAGQRKYWYDTEPLAVSGAYHCSLMAEGRKLIAGDLERIGLDYNRYPAMRPVISCHDGSRLDQENDVTRTILDIQFTGSVNWPATLASILASHPDLFAIRIPGPGTGLKKLTAGQLFGLSVRVTSTEEAARVQMEITGRMPDVCPDDDGRTRYGSRFTKRFGLKPIILGGMTPTTATSRIVAAAAAHGVSAELAGGGQVTEKIFRTRMDEIRDLLAPNAGVVLNTLYLDPWLHDLHIRKEGLLFKLKREGYPFTGFTLTAGIPPVGEAVELLDRAAEHGMFLNSFKAGTPEQIEQVMAIAKGAPHHEFVLQLEGGEGGGHHSWYGLRNLLHRSWARLRDLPNLILAAGGGIRDSADVLELLDGSWCGGAGSRPLDAVVVGTLAMACLEAETSPQVKAALVAARGEPSGWSSGKSDVTSGVSALGAPVWYLRNTASGVAAMTDRIAGDSRKLPQLREKLTELMNRTAKPFFGDPEQMSCGEILKRYVALVAVGRDLPHESGIWQSPGHADKFRRLIRRFQERLNAVGESGDILSDPHGYVDRFLREHPILSSIRPLPQDAAFLLDLFDEPGGKPLPFVARLDSDVRRRYLSDSLFFSHDDRHDADRVLVLPGPRAVGGIIQADQPFSALCDSLLEKVLPVNLRIEENREIIWDERSAPVQLGKSFWADLLLCPFVDTSQGLERNPLQAFFRPVPGDAVSLRSDGFDWKHGNHAKLELHIMDGIISGHVLLETVRAEPFLLPLEFVPGEGWSRPRWNKDKFDACLADLYRNEVFRPAMEEENYARIFTRPPEFRSFPFLPWYASAALGDMVARIRENPLGLLHYKSAARLVERKTPAPGFDPAEVADRAMRGHIGPVEVEGEFIPAGGGKSGAAQSGLPSTDAESEEILFENDVILGETSLEAPGDARNFALVGGDLNPLHSDEGFASFLGFPGPIHHGLWSQARVVAELERAMVEFPRRVTGLRSRFIGPVRFGERLDFRFLRRGRAKGSHLIRAVVSGKSGVKLESDLVVEPFSTAYVCPGQGVQKQGMHEPAFSRSAAAKEIWIRADVYTREHLGFSLLEAVRDNPRRMTVGDREVFHPEGVLNLTQFTQVALVVFSCAAVAELRESGAFVGNAHFSGHSLGEYSALSAIGDLLTLEDVVRVVYHRGLTMQNFVPRDASGNSPFRLGVVRPNHAGISESAMFELVSEIAGEPGCHVEIVNHNCRGRQYAVTGYIRGLEELRKRLGNGVTGKAPYVEVPGIDVPFHSSLLRDGVDAFRKTLESVFPQEIPPARLEGRYWPNLTGKAFSLSLPCLDDVFARTGSERIARLKQELEAGIAVPEKAVRILLIEMLAWQFASPVQWIAIQEGLVAKNVRHVVEIGPGHQPTLTNLLHQSLAGIRTRHPVVPLHMENDRDLVLGTSTEDGFCVFPVPTGSTIQSSPEVAMTAGPASPSPEPVVPESVPQAASVPTGAVATAADPVACGLGTLLAQLAGCWPAEIDEGRSLEDLLQGNSARRNQMLSELQKEFRLKKTDGLADLPKMKLVDAIRAQTGGNYSLPGPNLSAGLKELYAALPGVQTSASVELPRRYAMDPAGAMSLLVSLIPFAREGKSKLTGAGNPYPFPAANAVDSWRILEQAARSGLGLDHPAEPAGASPRGGGQVDSAELHRLREEILGADGVFRKIHKTLGEATGASELQAPSTPVVKERNVIPVDVPVFDEDKAVLFSSAENWIREDAMHLVGLLESGLAVDELLQARILRRFSPGATGILRARMELDPDPGFRERLAPWLEKLEATVSRLESAQKAQGQDRVLIVTGAGPNSIAQAVIRQCLNRGWIVLSGVSRLDDDRVRQTGDLYREYASSHARMEVVPFRQGNFQDVDDFARWAVSRIPENAGVFLLPFAALGHNGMAQDIGFEHENALRVNLLGVERLTGRIAQELDGRRSSAGTRPGTLPEYVTVVLPMSPNEGEMGGDGLYGESKIALKALMNKWASEPLLRRRTRMIGAIIGWVRGTGLMHGQDDMALQMEKALGVSTFDVDGMARRLMEVLDTATGEPSPGMVDLTGGLSQVPDWGEAFRNFRSGTVPDTVASRVHAKPVTAQHKTSVFPFLENTNRKVELHPRKGLDWKNWVVIVGYGEIGPFGNGEARWQMECHGQLLPDQILHVAMMMGLLRYDPETGGFSDPSTGSRFGEVDAVAHVRDRVHAGIGIRERPSTGSDADGYQSVEAVTLDEPRIFPVESLESAREIQRQDPANTEILEDRDGNILVRKKAGSKVYMGTFRTYNNTVAGMLPSGWHPSFFGFSEADIADRDRNTLLMLTATCGAIRSMGRSMKELFRTISPIRTGNALGTGIGGMERLIRLYTDPVWNNKRDPVSLQESLGNVGAGHVSQEILGNYGPMVSPVSACATAGISMEIAWEKLKLNRADFMVAGAFDDISYAGTVGFDDMSATVNSGKLREAGIPASRMSRPQDRRRKGFVESQGGGCVFMMRAKDAVQMGLPIYGVIARTWSFGDGIHQSIPAPGYGALSVARGRENSELAMALGEHGLTIDEIGVVSLHGTSTPVNDPHETGLFQEIFSHLGRTPGNPAMAVSQKAITGHTKGGASACQVIGVIQMMRDGLIPGHRNLDDLDEKQQGYSHLVFPARTQPAGSGRLSGALVSTLGFGHVSSLILMVNPDRLLSELDPQELQEYQAKMSCAEPGDGMRVLLGIVPQVQLEKNRPFAGEEAEKRFLLGGETNER